MSNKIPLTQNMITLREELLRMETTHRNPAQDFTKPALTALCVAGRKLKYSVYASRVDAEHKDGCEWLYDVTWCEYDQDVLKSVPLVAECEWAGKADRLSDFEKLLVAKAPIKVMVYDGGHADDLRFPGALTELTKLYRPAIDAFERADADQYMFAAWVRCSPDTWRWEMNVLPVR